MPKQTTERIDSLLQSITDDMLGAIPNLARDNSLQVEVDCSP